MNILFLAHSVPYPPNKGEKIRAFEEIKALAREHRVHLACFARDAADADGAEGLQAYCESVHVEVPPLAASLARGAARFLSGGCLNEGYFENRAMHAHVNRLAGNVALDAAVAYTLPMCQYVPRGVPRLFDMVDADSEKWAAYARMRRLGFLYEMESRRLRERELWHGSRADAVYLTTLNETRVFRGAIADQKLKVMENGVDFGYFDPGREYPMAAGGGQYVVFVGTMDYFPNIDAACWFAEEMLPKLRARHAGMRFVIVGNRPAKAVRQLAGIAGVVVTGGVADVRPFLANAAAVATPLRLARGIQNKVLEALAMGRRVLASAEVCRTFGGELPFGVERCRSIDEFMEGVSREAKRQGGFERAIRDAAVNRFSWERNLDGFVSQINAIARVPVHQ